MSSEPENETPLGGETSLPEPEEGRPEGEGAAPTPTRPRRRSRGILLAAAAIILAVALYNALMARTLGAQEVHLYGQDCWSPGLPASLRVVLIRHRDQRPIEGASVRVLLSRPKAEIVELASGRTDAAGTIEPSFTVPEGEGPARLVVKAESPSGSDFVDRPIRLVPAYRILLASDQPAYRVGQRVRLQAGVSRWGTGEPEGNRTVSLRAFAPDGIPFAVRSVRTDERGGAAAEFELAPDAPAGAYRFKASAGSSAVELSLPVTAAPDPPFPIRLGDVTRYAVPGGLVSGYVVAQDRLGSYLRDATVRVWMENAAGRTVSWTSGRLDPQGRLSFGLPAPQADDLTMLRLCAEATDSGLRSARAMQAVAVTPHPIQLAAIPEARALVPGIANRVYLAARYPDGTPAQATIRYAVAGVAGKAKCSSLGVATIDITPGREDAILSLTASDAQGRAGVYQATLPLARVAQAEWALRERFRLHAGRPESGARPQPLLIRPDRGLYRPGDTLDIEVLAPRTDQVIYVDGYAGGQTLFSRTATPRGGRATLRVRLPEVVSGLVWLRAYVLGPWGDAAYADRAVFALPMPATALSLRLDRPVREPGQAARMALALQETGAVGFSISRVEGGSAVPTQTLAAPGALTVPLRPGAPRAEGGTADAAWVAATEQERSEAALAALSQAPGLEGWSLHEDIYARKRAALQARQAASWGWLRWMVLVLFSGLWLLATRALAQSSRENGGSENGGGTVASALRFITLTMAVALAATLLFRLVGPDRVAVRGDLTNTLLKAIQQEREKGARWSTRNTPTLPPAVQESQPVPQVGFWTLAAAAEAQARPGHAFAAPAFPGDWTASALVLSGQDAPARVTAPLHVESALALEFVPPPAVCPGDVVSVPLRVRNPRPGPQTVRLKLMAGPGLSVVDEPAWTEEIPGGAGITRSLRVSVQDRLGRSALTLAASGSGRLETLRKEIDVRRPAPDTTVAQAGRTTKPVTYPVDVEGGVDQASVTFQGTPGAVVAAYLADLPVEFPFSTLERAAALDIARMALQTGEAGTRASQAALERSFQALLACRDDETGGFAAHPGDKPDGAATAYSVAVLDAVGDAVPGADAVARRARRWLGRQPNSAPGWPAPWGDTETDAALSAWALGPGSRAAQDLRAHYRIHQPLHEDPYLLSILSLGLGEHADNGKPPVDGDSLSVLEHLVALGTSADAGQRWLAAAKTLQGFSRDASAVETTALAVLALAPHPKYREHVERGMDYLAAARGPDGGWGGLFGTSLALRALLAAAPVRGASGALDVAVNGQVVARLDARHARADLRGRLRQGENDVSLTPVGGKGALYAIRVTGPDLVRPEATGSPELTSDVMPRRARPGQAVRFTARIAGDTPNPVRLEIPIPAGFRPLRSDLDRLVQQGEALGFRIGARRVWIDVDTGRKRQARWVEMRLVAPGRCSVSAPAPVAYPVADPDARATGRTLRLVVE